MFEHRCGFVRHGSNLYTGHLEFSWKSVLLFILNAEFCFLKNIGVATEMLW